MRDFSLNNDYPFERRRYPRFKVRFFLITGAIEQPVHASIIDISRKGIGMLSSEGPSGDELDLSIKFSLGKNKKTDIQMRAHIVWKRGIVMHNLYRCGLEILDIFEPFQQNFNTCIHSLAEKKQ